MAANALPVLPETSIDPHPISEFFLARQPILNRDQNLFAYELLFRAAEAGPANVTDDVAATASVIAHASELGMENVIGASLAFINVDARVLMSDFIRFLPRQKVVLEILETVRVTEPLIARVKELVQEGYVFALDDVVADSHDVLRLLPLVDIIKVDINEVSNEDLPRLSRHFRQAQKKLLAEKVETPEQFQICLDCGFDYFQGYYFAKPMVLSGRKPSPSQIVVMHLLGQIISDADGADIERIIMSDPPLGLMLLRLANNPATGLSQAIDTLGQALAVLGRRQLHRWLQILLYAQPARHAGGTSPLLVLATSRGKLLELIAEKIDPGNSHVADTAFTVGTMSLMDALLRLPMERILNQVPVAEEVKDALLSRSGLYGDMLRLVECIEHIEEAGPLLPGLLKKLHLSGDELYALQVAAFEWSDTVAHSTA